MKNKTNKKEWKKPAVISLDVKSLTAGGTGTGLEAGAKKTS